MGIHDAASLPDATLRKDLHQRVGTYQVMQSGQHLKNTLLLMAITMIAPPQETK